MTWYNKKNCFILFFLFYLKEIKMKKVKILYRTRKNMKYLIKYDH